MILLDTNVLIYAAQPRSRHAKWARDVIVGAVAGEGAAINAVTLAEICVGDEEPSTVADRIRTWGVEILDLPAAAAGVCADAYRLYLSKRSTQAKAAPTMPPPHFFIGAHAAIMRWEIATADRGRFATYFPSVRLKMPNR